MVEANFVAKVKKKKNPRIELGSILNTSGINGGYRYNEQETRVYKIL